MESSRSSSTGDVDGNDYWLWEALREYAPRVVVIEYNEYHRPPVRWVMTYNPARYIGLYSKPGHVFRDGPFVPL